MPKVRDGDSIDARLYTRKRGGDARYYSDFRDFTEVGGKQEALVPEGGRRATSTLAEARDLATARLQQLEALRALRPTGSAERRTLGAFAAHHLKQKAAAGRATVQWLGAAQEHLETARDFFGDARDLAMIQVQDVSAFVEFLSQQPNGRGGSLGGGTITQYLNSLSNLYRRAISESLVPMGANPVRAMLEMPLIERAKTPWLEVHDAAAILKAAREWEPSRDDLAIPHFFEVLATMMLTGCRETEVYGLRRSELNLERRTITIQPNHWRRLKTKGSERVLHVFTQLLEILTAYLESDRAPAGDLVFPGRSREGEQMITDLRKAFDRLPMPERLRRPRTETEMERLEKARQDKIDRWVNRRRGPKPIESLEELQAPVDPTVIPPLRSRMLRHTYTAARLQTLDGGEAISVYMVAAELGHSDTNMIRKVYGHLGKFRKRGDEVEYRWETSTHA